MKYWHNADLIQKASSSPSRTLVLKTALYITYSIASVSESPLLVLLGAA